MGVKQRDIKVFTWGSILLVYTFLLVFTGRFEQYSSLITKGLTPLFVLAAVFFFKNPIAKFPKEYFAYVVLFGWAILSGIKVESFSNYTRFLQLFLGITMLLTIVYVLIPRYNIVNFFHVGFLLGAMFLLRDAYLNFDLAAIVNQEVGGTRLEGQAGNANTIGAIFLMAGLSNLFLFDSAKNLLIKAVLVVAQVLLIIGVVATASRSSLLAIVLSVLLYITFKLIIQKQYVILLGALFLILSGLTLSYNYIMEQTYLGTRIDRLQKGKDGSEEERSQLIRDGIQMVRQNPFMGVGIGNFTNNSSSGRYSHNDILEVTATLGFIGLFIYSTFFVFPMMSIRRLRKKDILPKDRGRIMVIGVSTFIYLLSGLFKPLFVDLFFMFFIGALYADLQRIKLKYAYLSNYQHAQVG
ncbi:MAG: O-antigen ligase family protein [Bacteroidota bacterium]